MIKNLNAHSQGSLCLIFAPAQTNALWKRFKFIHRLKHDSWLNMTEIKLNVLTRQCLNRHIDKIKTLENEVIAWQTQHDLINAKIY
ncbi:MAG: hypothetical protein ACTXOO_00240 [Sodalis sp. (in: enterobacteria)]